MKNALLGLLIAIAAFYLGITCVRFFDYTKQIYRIRPAVEYQINADEYPSFQKIVENNVVSENFPDLGNVVSENFPDLGIAGAYYYNLPSSKGKHAPDFFLEGGLYVRRKPSPIDLQPFFIAFVKKENDKFLFETQEVDGVKYLMKGRMPNAKNGFTIKGKIIKYYNGVIVKKINVVFREAIPNC